MEGRSNLGKKEFYETRSGCDFLLGRDNINRERCGQGIEEVFDQSRDFCSRFETEGSESRDTYVGYIKQWTYLIT